MLYTTAQCSDSCTGIQKMENIFPMMNGISDSWMDIAIEMTIAFLCGVGFFFLLTPFLKECPVSSPPESESDIPKDVKRRQSKTRKKTTTVRGCRDGGKNVEQTKTSLQPMEICTGQLLQDSTPQPLWDPLQHMDHYPLFQRLNYFKFWEHLIWKEFSHIFWGLSSMFSESVLATAHILRNPSLSEHKTVRFCDTCDPAQTLAQAQGLPQFSKDLPLSPELVTSSLESVTSIQEMKKVPSSTSNQTPPCFKRRACGIAHPSTEKGTQTSLPTENPPGMHGLYYRDTNGSDIQNHQKAICKPTQTSSRGTQHTTAVRSASILPEHCQIVHNNEESQNEDKAPNVREQQGTPATFHPSMKLTQLQEQISANSTHYCSGRPQLSQPSILTSKSYKCNKMIKSLLLGVPVKKDTANCDKNNTIKKGLGLGDKDVPCISCRSLEKGLKRRDTAMRTDKLFYMYPTEHHSFLDSKTDRKLEPNLAQLPVKSRSRPLMQVLESRDQTPPWVPASKLPQVGFPSSPICGSKAEYYSKAAMILENLHHQDPGGKRVESISDTRLQSALYIHSPAELQETQRDQPPAASHGASKAQPDHLHGYLSVQQPAFCFQAKPPQNRNIRGTGRGSQQSNATPKMAKNEPLKKFQEVGPDQPCWRVIVIDPEERIPPLAAQQSDIGEGKEEPPPAWTVSLRSSEIHNEQAISIGPRDFGSLEADKNPGHLQTPTPLHSQDSGVN
ncbi:spermatogenesis-associated protein 31-like, partial [Mastomys coucha]|uniref:spermatogenesis-associated protein 31-like n=1 Tax=Mastomys coucha TaxID=35658 RepID=UPI00126296C7